MSVKTGHAGRGVRTSTVQVMSYPRNSTWLPSGQQPTSKGYAAGWLFLVLGILVLVIMLGMAMGLQDAMVGTWPHTGLVVVTYTPEIASHYAESSLSASTQSETREMDLSIVNVRTMLGSQHAVGNHEAEAAGLGGMASPEPHDGEGH
jgi:hypothetical protein